MNTTSPKTILVTGASRGIGKAIALRFSREGWQVAITCLQKKDQLLETAGEIEDAGGVCLPFVGVEWKTAGNYLNKLKKNSAGWTCWSTMPAFLM